MGSTHLFPAVRVNEFKFSGPCYVRMKRRLVDHIARLQGTECDVQFMSKVLFPQSLFVEQLTKMGLAVPPGWRVNVSRRSHV